MTDVPLDGVRVVVTRAREQSAALIESLEALGAEAVPVPVIRIEDPPDGGAELRRELGALIAGDWLVITSPNGATRVGAALERPLAAGVSVAVIGPGTKAKAEAAGLDVNLVPSASIAEGLLEFLPVPGAGGGTMLLARAETGRELLPTELRRRGWDVRDVAAYRTVGVDVDPDAIEACRQADVVAFTSASTVRHLVAGVGAENLPPLIACIGPATSDQAGELGIDVDITATEHSIPGIVTAIADAVPNLVLLRPEPAADADSQWMLEQYFTEIDERFETGLDRDNVLTSDTHEISPPNGLFIAGRLGVEPVACGVLKKVVPDVADIKRMWVSDRVRGRGVGRRLLERLVAEGRAMGLRRVQLETNEALTEAIALYRSAGFTEVEAFNDEPHAHHWFALEFDRDA
ncbi:MAG: GNAT family N-acetyltransferase [Acidimicrobiales bacterium]|jgi:uroporphyrinogen-III synthase/predicted GNAT family acetyltransferase|nr:GNAT family N-acetyltransferase [Acidimicrobiales bacterium]